MNTTTITITDPNLLAQIAAADGHIVFRGPTGDTVKTVATVAPGALPPGAKGPLSDAEFEAARKQTGGSPLLDVWKRIHERYGA